ncbi:hypothetical protein DMB66_01830 [Actinoplanes sp. ATCC 53533]|uniref:hypothetical protein n=1 Tax=Actinoplanes sp. ATCC 53533 TaxID=1288362 RepID=UPI000F7B4A09|nr:hypothetical protein [Actinoplanes sp. ATCC 53533]RSM74179.1 hypothetical protein DMB66_01830 [Actinoplanes sp. ATCC 53533]
MAVLGLAAMLLSVTAGGTFLALWRYDLLPRDPAPAMTNTAGDTGDQTGDQTGNDPGGDTGGPGPGFEDVIPQTESTTDPERAALDQLDEISRRDLAAVSPRGQYVAQLASKNPGIYDKRQTTADGSHTFQAVDILRQYQALRDDPANGGTAVVLLKSTDYGKRVLYHGEPLYVTFALGDFRDRQDVLGWCARRFPGLSGDALTNQCMVQRLRPGS